jgi:hypothetical protein
MITIDKALLLGRIDFPPTRTGIATAGHTDLIASLMRYREYVGMVALVVVHRSEGDSGCPA